jgi:hypothetical protein
MGRGGLFDNPDSRQATLTDDSNPSLITLSCGSVSCDLVSSREHLPLRTSQRDDESLLARAAIEVNLRPATRRSEADSMDDTERVGSDRREGRRPAAPTWRPQKSRF